MLASVFACRSRSKLNWTAPTAFLSSSQCYDISFLISRPQLLWFAFAWAAKCCNWHIRALLASVFAWRSRFKLTWTAPTAFLGSSQWSDISFLIPRPQLLWFAFALASKSHSAQARSLARIGFRSPLALLLGLDGATCFPRPAPVLRYLIFNTAAPAPLVRVCVAAKDALGASARRYLHRFSLAACVPNGIGRRQVPS